MITIDMSSIVPTVSNFVMLKISAITALSIIFSPIAIVLMLLFSFGIPYLIAHTVLNTNANWYAKISIKTSDIFRRNKSLISIMFILSLLVNVTYNMNNIVEQSTAAIKPYSDACIYIPEKMLDMNYTDEYIKDAMSKSGCNPGSFESTKLFWKMIPKPRPPAHYFRNQYGNRERQET